LLHPVVRISDGSSDGEGGEAKEENGRNKSEGLHFGFFRRGFAERDVFEREGALLLNIILC